MEPVYIFSDHIVFISYIYMRIRYDRALGLWQKAIHLYHGSSANRANGGGGGRALNFRALLRRVRHIQRKHLQV
jgi:hypothetical protein